ncbi:MAG: hypothetical protein EOP07_09985 [Proteobacteria bacterium]|nr:MAG: hypothetical protein EOP07_09985 [Pseudomonadota bacterium]
MKKSSCALIVSTIIVLIACSQRPKWAGLKKGGGGIDSVKVPAANETGDMATPAPGTDLVWKRYRAFENGLVKGLALDKKDFCSELGKESCIDKVHLTVLGGNEPYESGQYERAQTPTALTAVAVDRIVLTACSKRLELDRQAAAAAVVFKHFPLSGAAPDAKALEAQTTELYRRLLARNPEANEIAAVEAIRAQNLTADKLALMLCFAIGTSAENILL